MRFAQRILPGVVIAVLLTTTTVSQAVAFRSSVFRTLPLIGSLGGTSFTRRCPAGHVLTGIRARTGAVVDGIGIRCSAIESDGDLGTSVARGTMAGGSGGT